LAEKKIEIFGLFCGICLKKLKASFLLFWKNEMTLPYLAKCPHSKLPHFCSMPTRGHYGERFGHIWQRLMCQWWWWWHCKGLSAGAGGNCS
jgi:hypothetical protein